MFEEDDDDTTSIADSFNERQETSEKPLLCDYDKIDVAPSQTYQPVIVKSVLKRSNTLTSVTKSRRRYNVLLFGDNLTAGWVKNADGYGTYHPYGLKVQKRFEEEGLDVEVTVSGVPGECVVHSMEERLKNELNQPGKWYDWIVILGGTNDVVNGFSAWDIFDGLKKLYMLSFKHGARVLGVTIPEFDWVTINHHDHALRA
ncbi:10810_t:CDS:2 [Acaulospora colombiana]|uniref:10810_t:CDS:1 n=1 Tax=Acaulospora colombiana TaxID=27376 RepID=A0ACA9K6Q0_9GLOM|nr:10810_t:CDS:2 [Acaulospora colombiana]